MYAKQHVCIFMLRSIKINNESLGSIKNFDDKIHELHAGDGRCTNKFNQFRKKLKILTKIEKLAFMTYRKSTLKHFINKLSSLYL